MAIDTTPSTVATNALQAIPFSSLIGGPLDAAIQAQAMAAKTSWEFIQEVGLNTDESGQKNAVNVTFYYNKNGALTKLIVPLLTIVPIPYIAIDDIKIDFKANISASSSSTNENKSSSKMSAGVKGGAKLNYGIFSVNADFNANYSSKKDSKATEESKYSVEYTMDVSVHAGQSDMPAGLATVLNILQSSITDANHSGTFTLSPASPIIDLSTYTAGDPQTIELKLAVKDGDGLLMKDTEVKLVKEDFNDNITITVPEAPSKTNERGEATFKVQVTAEEGTTDGSGEFKFSVVGEDELQFTAEVGVIGEVPKTIKAD